MRGRGGEGEGRGRVRQSWASVPPDSDTSLPRDLGSVTPRPHFRGLEAQFRHLRNGGAVVTTGSVITRVEAPSLGNKSWESLG